MLSTEHPRKKTNIRYQFWGMRFSFFPPSFQVWICCFCTGIPKSDINPRFKLTNYSLNKGQMRTGKTKAQKYTEAFFFWNKKLRLSWLSCTARRSIWWRRQIFQCCSLSRRRRYRQTLCCCNLPSWRFQWLRVSCSRCLSVRVHQHMLVLHQSLHPASPVEREQSTVNVWT